MELKRVVVTGIGAVTPLGNSAEETWKNLLKGVSGAAPITQFDSSKCKTHFACEIKDLNINDWLDRKVSRKIDRYSQIAMISAIQAVQDSGMDLEAVDKNRIGVVYGVGIGGIPPSTLASTDRTLLRLAHALRRAMHWPMPST